MLFIWQIVPLFFIGVTICAAVETPGKQALDIAKEGIETLDKTLGSYAKITNELIQWDELNKYITELGKYQRDNSNGAEEQIDEVKTLLLNGTDAYSMAMQLIYEFCELSPILLTTYFTFSSKSNEAAPNLGTQKQILLRVLDDGIEQMNATQQNLVFGSLTFNDAAGILSSLYTRLHNDFYDHLKSKVKQISNETATTKVQLDDEIRKVADLRIQLRNSQYVLPTNPLRDVFIESAHKLINHCEQYNRNNQLLLL